MLTFSIVSVMSAQIGQFGDSVFHHISQFGAEIFEAKLRNSQFGHHLIMKICIDICWIINSNSSYEQFLMIQLINIDIIIIEHALVVVWTEKCFENWLSCIKTSLNFSNFAAWRPLYWPNWEFPIWSRFLKIFRLLKDEPKGHYGNYETYCHNYTDILKLIYDRFYLVLA